MISCYFFFARYEDAFNRFIDEINLVAAYEWWEGSIHSILSVLAYPCAWSWKQWRRRKKIHRLQEYVKSEYDHSCLRSCRSRALYKGLKVSNCNSIMLCGARARSGDNFQNKNCLVQFCTIMNSSRSWFYTICRLFKINQVIPHVDVAAFLPELISMN